MMDFIKKMAEEKKEYKENMARVEKLPEDYRYVFDKIQSYLWSFTGGDGYDMLKLIYGLIELFESGAANGKHVLDVTGDDVAAFCDELLKNARKWTDNPREKLNRDIAKRIKRGDSAK